VLDRRREELKRVERDLKPLEAAASTPYPRITYDDAIARLKAKGFEVKWGDDFGGDEETALSSEFDRPVMVHRYPTACKAFYMKQDSGAARGRAMRRYAGAGRSRRDHRRRSARR